jgi:hypothetical protein
MQNDNPESGGIHPDFDGHLERRLRDLPPKEKLLYLSQQIELMYFARHKVKRVERRPDHGRTDPGA